MQQLDCSALNTAYTYYKGTMEIKHSDAGLLQETHDIKKTRSIWHIQEKAA